MMPKKKTTPRKKPTGPDYIHEDLWPLVVGLDEIKLDRRNARLHDQRNISAIAASLRQFGQIKPIVVNRKTKIIEAGNGTFHAAGSLDWTQIAVVWVDHDPASAAGFKVADNRTAELATWDDTLLLELIGEIGDASPDLAAELQLAELQADLIGTEGEIKLTQITTRPPPPLTWVLVGIPTIRFSEIAPAVESMAAVEGVTIESTSTDEKKQ